MKTLTLLKTMKAYAAMHNIPIIEQESMDWLAKFLAHQEITNILEIGGAIGYSTIYLQAVTDAAVLSVEKDAARFEQAQIFLHAFTEKELISFIHEDAKSESFLKLVQRHAPFELLFIDAAKRSNQYFFEAFAPFIAPKGYIITDNLYFRGLANVDAKQLAQLPRRLRPMVQAVAQYRDWLTANEQFTTKFIAVGDGLAVSQKIG